jgi:hypothetical protein
MSLRFITSSRSRPQKVSPMPKLSISPKLKIGMHNYNIYKLHKFPRSPISSLSRIRTSGLKLQASYTPNRSSSISKPSPQPKPKPKKNKLRKKSNRKISLGFSTNRKTENFRYAQKNLEECESYKNLNGVSTPPEDESVLDRSTSPFSDVIQQELSNYINQSAFGISRLELPKVYSGYTEDSYQYSTTESRKRESYKFSFEKNVKTPEPPKTPVPFSIYSKIYSISSVRIRNKKCK